MSTSTVVTLITTLKTDVMGVLNDTLPVVLGAFAVLVGVAFGIHLFRKYVFKKKV